MGLPWCEFTTRMARFDAHSWGNGIERRARRLEGALSGIRGQGKRDEKQGTAALTLGRRYRSDRLSEDGSAR
jgi:hypothetical protein